MSKLGDYANLQKFKWINRWQCQSTKNKGAVGWLCESTKNKVARKKKHPIYVVKPSEWGKPPQGKTKKRIYYVIKLEQNRTQVLPLLEFHKPQDMLTILTISSLNIFSLWKINFSFSHSPCCDTHHYFLAFLHNSLWLEVSLWKKWSLVACIYRQNLKAQDGLNWWEFRWFLIGRKNRNSLLAWKGA